MSALRSSALPTCSHSCHVLETLQDTDISVTVGTELHPCWRWLGRDEAFRDVGSWLPQGRRQLLLLRPEHGARGWGRLLPAAARVSLVDFGFCLSTCSLSSAPNPVINFKIYYGSHREATPCHSFYILLTHFHKNNRFTVGAVVQAHV